MDRRSPVVLLVAVALCCAGTPDHTIETESDLRAIDSPLLRERLSSDNVEQRVRAARAIGRIQSPAYIDALAASLADEEPGVRQAALFALGQLGLYQDRAVDPRAAEAVRPLLQSTDVDTLAAALDATGKLAGVEAAGEIATFLQHGDPRIRAEAAFALFRLRFAPLWRRESTEPPGLPDTAVVGLIGAMDDADHNVRFAATYAFSRYGDPRARAALARATTDATAAVRLFAVRGLGHVTDETVAAPLIARLKDEDAGVRTEAVTALDRAGSYDVLERHVGDPSFHVRAALATALGHADSPGSIDQLERLEADTSVTVRSAAIGALAERLGAAVLARARSWAASEDWRIRAAAARATAGLDEALATHGFGDSDVRVRAAVLEGLAGTTVGDSIVTRALEVDDLAIRGGAVALVAEREHLGRLELLGAAYDGSPGNEWIEVRESIVDAVADLDGATELLVRIANHDDAASVRGKASAALDAEPIAVEPSQAKGSRWIGMAPPAGIHVDLETTHGTMRIEVLSEEAPIHAAAFLDRVDAGFYDGLIWHRVVSNFVIQGGDPRGDGWGSEGENLRDEVHRVRYGRGALGMPKAGKDTGGCQLFITHVPTPHLDGNYTIFGQVVSGLEVIDAIEVGDAILSIERVR